MPSHPDMEKTGYSGSLKFGCYYRMAHEKPARRLVYQRGLRSRTLHRKLNKCKCKVF